MQKTNSQIVDAIGVASKPRTLVDFVTVRLRDAIATGRLAPGQRLWQDQLAQESDVSRVPVREALRQLASEGLVILQSHRSATVSELSADEMEELFAMIVHLETLVVERAVNRITTKQLDEMSDLLRSMRGEEDDPGAWYILNVAFHRTFIQAANWPTVLRTLDACRHSAMRYVIVDKIFRSEVGRWSKRNAKLLGACRDRDAKQALQIIKEGQEVSDRVIRLYAARTPG